MAKPTVDELSRQVESLQRLLAQHGIRPEPERLLPPEERPDYIPHGSEGHAQLLGLVEVAADDDTEVIATFTSARSGRTFRLEDELGAIRHYPGIDPEKAVRLVLQQKVNELEIHPTVPEDAPAMFVPVEVYSSG